MDNIGTLTNNGALTNTSGSTLSNVGTLNNDGTLTNNGTLDNWDTLTNNAVLNNNGTLTNDDTLNNYGTLNNNDGTLTNNGILNLNGGGTMTVAGGVVNAATMTNDGTFNFTGGTVDATTIDNNGTFNFSGGTLNVDTFNGDLNNTGGTLGPGHSPGTTTINGNYSKDEFSTLLIEIAGTMAGSEYDVLNVTGDASLNDGVLRLNLLDGFAPVIGDPFVILQSANIIGAFGGIYSTTALGEGLRWELDYSINLSGNDFLTARVSAGPIPAPVPLPLWLFVVLSALIGGLGYRRLYIA